MLTAAASLAISLLVIEGSFIAAGFIVKARIKNGHQEKGGAFRILCLGDSSTYGTGASDRDKYSYPAQLQELLDKSGMCGKFEVINLGLPGENSSQLLGGLEKNISRYKPDMLIVMIGINDPWDLQGSRIIEFYKASPLKRGLMKLDLMLNKIHLYRLLKLAMISRELHYQAKPASPPYIGFNDLSRARGFPYSRKDPGKSQAFYYCLKHNITEIAFVAEKHRLPILFMNYHNRGWGSPEIGLQRIYAGLGLPIVDNWSVFIKARKEGLNVRSGDGWHPNDLGYSLIAKDVYDKMLSLRLGNNCLK
jgi:lysophospholipase L1-like esterase